MRWRPPRHPSGTRTYVTDLTDELVSLTLEDDTTVDYTHDASGNRTSRSIDGVLDASWAWDDLSALPMRIGEYDSTGTLATSWLADPTSTTGASLAQTTNGASSWLLSDPFANTVATVSTTGDTVSGTRTMNAFGVERTSATGALADAAVGFAGQYLDAATGLYDMRARDYDPTSGRFTATDPVAVPTGMPYIAGYTYAYNNPLMFTDASGNLASGRVKDDWLDDAAAWSAAFGDTVTFGGTEQIRLLIMYEQGSGDVDMVDHSSDFYQWGGYGGDTANVGLALIGGAGCAKTAFSRIEQTMAAVNRAETGAETLAGAESLAGAGGAVNITATGIEAGSGAGSLRIVGSGFSASERGAAEFLARQGHDVVLRAASGLGRTSDLLVDGIPYDVYTPITGSIDRIVSEIAKKGSQVKGGGVVVDLSRTLLSGIDAGDLLARVQGVTSSVTHIIILGG